MIKDNYEIEELIEKILLITSANNKRENIEIKLRRELSRLYNSAFVHGQLSALGEETKKEIRDELLK